MFNTRTKIMLASICITASILALIYYASTSNHFPLRFLIPSAATKDTKQNQVKQKNTTKKINDAFILLKKRKDKEALIAFGQILSKEPDNIDALWGKAEALRRNYNLKEAKIILQTILKHNPGHIPSRISLSYLIYNDNNLIMAQRLIQEVLKEKHIDRQNQALAYIMLGMINSKRSSQSWLPGKIKFGLQIKDYFLRATDLAPDLPEAHLGLGTFYLLAPTILGGDQKKAIEELELTVALAPEFASANIRLAQAYKRIGIVEKYDFYLNQAKKIDPNNEFLKEPENVKY
jgi:tetratricopeptide (TPR) repeat protein